MSKEEAKERVRRIIKGNTRTLPAEHQLANSQECMNEEDIAIMQEQLFELIDKIIKK